MNWLGHRAVSPSSDRLVYFATAFSAVLDISENYWVGSAGPGKGCLVSSVLEAPKAKNTMGVIIRLRYRRGLSLRAEVIAYATSKATSVQY
jgi:hypothetical protein